MNKFFVLSLLVVAASALPTPDTGLNCLPSNDIVSCFAVKVSAQLNRAGRLSEVKLFDGISFVRDAPLEISGKSLDISEKQLLDELPGDVSERAAKLSTIIYDSASNFLKTHSLKLDSQGPIARAIENKVSEGRAKVKKYLPLLYSAAAFKVFALIPILLSGLALLVLKAVVIGKMALIAAGVLLFQKLMGSSGGLPALFNKSNVATPSWTDPGTQSWPAPSAVQNQGYYRRSYEQDAHNLAYSAHAPTTLQQSA